MSRFTQPIPMSEAISAAESFIDRLMERPAPKYLRGINNLVAVIGVPAIDETDLALLEGDDLPQDIAAAMRGRIIAGLPSGMNDIFLKGLATGVSMDMLLQAADPAFRKGRADGARLVDAQYMIHLFAGDEKLNLAIYPKQSVSGDAHKALCTSREVIPLEDTKEMSKVTKNGRTKIVEGYQHLILPNVWTPWTGDPGELSSEEPSHLTIKTSLEWGLPIG